MRGSRGGDRGSGGPDPPPWNLEILRKKGNFGIFGGVGPPLVCDQNYHFRWTPSRENFWIRACILNLCREVAFNLVLYQLLCLLRRNPVSDIRANDLNPRPAYRYCTTAKCWRRFWFSTMLNDIPLGLRLGEERRCYAFASTKRFPR